VKRIISVLVLVLAAVLTGGCGSSTAPAKVNGTSIDRGQFLDHINELSELSGGGKTFPTSDTADFLAYHVVAVLRTQELARLGLTVSDNDVAAARAEVEGSNLGLSKELTDFVVRVRADQNVLDARITDPDTPWFSDNDVNDYYEFVKDSKFVDYCVHHILVAAETDASAILNQLGNGADFGQIARERSTDTESATKGGDLGCVTKGQFVPAFEDAVLNANVGDTLGPIKSEFGYHVIRVDKGYGLHALDDTVRKTIATDLATAEGWLQWKVNTSKIDVNKKFGSWSNEFGTVVPPSDPTVK
jgi:foldase protein PrsA